MSNGETAKQLADERREMLEEARHAEALPWWLHGPECKGTMRDKWDPRYRRVLERRECYWTTNPKTSEDDCGGRWVGLCEGPKEQP